MTDFKVITSKENSLIKFISALQTSAKKRRENGCFVLEGLRICQDAKDNGIRFDKLIISESAALKYQSDIIEFAEISGECFKLPDGLFKKISDTTSPQGIIAVAKTPDKSSNEINKNGRYIALENLADPSNLGAVARTAEALGVSGIILSGNGCDAYAPKSLRASMGTLLRLPVFILNDFANEIKNTGLKTYSCVVDKDAKAINGIDFADGSILIIGNEANGITEETKSLSDCLLTIPMRGKAESLNSAVAASIAMWEMMK